MAGHITIRPAPGTWVVRAGDAIVAESTRALELLEGSRAGVIYLPRADVAMALLDRSTLHSTCPAKGEASYYSINTPGGVLADVVWSYETPHDDCAAIAGYMAFYTDQVTLERV